MPGLILPSRFNRQPQYPAQIDRANPLTLGLSYASAVGAGDTQKATKSGTINSSIAQWGRADSFVPSASKTAINPLAGNAAQGTIVVLHRSTVSAPNGPTYCHILASTTGTDNGDYNGWLLMLENGTSYPRMLIYGTSNNHIGDAPSTFALNDGKPHITAGYYDSAAGGVQGLVVDGSLISSSTHATNAATGNWFNRNLMVGYARDAGGFWGAFEGEIGAVLFFDRILTPAELRFITARPENLFSVFKAPPRYLFAASGGAGAVTGTASITPAAQTTTASGTVSRSATATITPSPQTLTTSAQVAINASATITPSPQTLSASGTVASGVTGTATISPAAQTATTAATVALTAVATITPAAQTVTTAAAVAISATASITPAAETATASGTVSRSATATISPSPQTLTASGTVAAAGTVTGAATISPAAQTVTAAGTVAIGATASISPVAQTVAGVASITITGTGNLVELAETLTASGIVTSGLVGSADLTQAAQTLTASGAVSGGGFSGTLSDEDIARIVAAVWASPLAPTASSIWDEVL